MAKILLVEDDSNLREIYGARLEAEGYEIVSASDGEEALAIAVKERPDLIISDVMMPKISGFDMLDILRTTPETKDVKVIVMTALSQEEDRKRGEQLGADRYLVKSQVTLDDVVGMVRELLSAAPAQTPAAAQPGDSIAAAQPQPASGDDPLPEPADASAADNTSQISPAPTPAQDDTNITPADAASLDQEVKQFVATSPLMGGVTPQAPPSDASAQEDSPQPPAAPPENSA